MCSIVSRSFSKVVCLTIFLISSFFISNAQGSTWVEAGDAGDLPGLAQTPTGGLTIITGITSTSLDADLYKIYISNPNTFSASVSGGDGTGLYDSALALFNQEGLGVYANDDAILGNGQPGLPANHALGPQTQGIYYLAIFDSTAAPTSGDVPTPDTFIFPSFDSPWTQIVGPTAEGGRSPLNGWFPKEVELPLHGVYSIVLTGVSLIPEPEAYGMLLAGLGMLAAVARGRKSAHRRMV
jgi:hypothetical protein